jgi:hypothetical protein
MNDLKCVSLINLRRFFLSMVFSQLYGLIFIDGNKIEFSRGVGIFVKSSLGLPESFPHVVAEALLGIKHVLVFQMEQRLKFMLCWENGETFPVFEALVLDRCVLFPLKVGLNARLGEVLSSLGQLKTLDYKEHYQVIVRALGETVGKDHQERLLATEGRVFWTEISNDGFVSFPLKQVLAKLSFEGVRVFALLLADMLCWAALKTPTRKCPFCSTKFTTEHFFSCPGFFSHGSGWTTLIRLCQEKSWVDVSDYVFEILRRWVTETNFFRPSFRLSVLEYEVLCEDVVYAAFRW